MVNDNSIFKFKFKPLNVKNDNMEYEVFTDNRKFMDIFLRQHNFNIDNVYIEIIDGCNGYNVNEVDVLSPFIFRSNKTNERFVVVSTSRFVTDAIENVCSCISDVSLFNDVMFRGDVELIDVITEMINSLPYAAVINHALVTDDGEFVSQYWERYTKSMTLCTDGWEHPMGDEYIYEMMFEAYTSSTEFKRPQPITIEAYVRNFRETLLDEF